MQFTYISILLVFISFVQARTECGSVGGDFNRTKLIMKENECVQKYSPQQCWVYGVKPEVMKANALITFKLFPQLVSDFTECLVQKMNEMKPEFVHNYNVTAINIFKYNCITKREACQFLKDYLIPLTCWIQRDCNKMLSDSLYAFTYGDLMLAAETSKTFRCFGSTQYDIKPNFFNLYTIATGANVVSTDLCSGVELPVNQEKRRRFGGDGKLH
ncbi:unnamed protein product [Bursaphelenchus okinawaensis]|uniref:DUF19 domain-containing protein n=1 Tax=Bursaphelenchus okinawaensis TaxID=465554 RepID=A0A811KCV6_9BILA|nr:unnamed protein product [Bursaphelenchus okinawaensis]CAG9097370.1 unnamed protein product [Bursaphelenchus okinawaensis]